MSAKRKPDEVERAADLLMTEQAAEVVEALQLCGWQVTVKPEFAYEAGHPWPAAFWLDPALLEGKDPALQSVIATMRSCPARFFSHANGTWSLREQLNRPPSKVLKFERPEPEPEQPA